MDFVLVFLLMLTFLSTGQSHAVLTEQQGNSSYKECPIGHYNEGGDCSVGKPTCRKCGDGTYTDIPNCTSNCRRCKPCGHYEVVAKPCSFDSNVECKCKSRYFYKIKPSRDGTSPQKPSSDDCTECNCSRKDIHDYPECKSQCPTPPAGILSSTNSSTAAPTSASTSTSTSASTSTSTSASASTRTTNNTMGPDMDQVQPNTWIETPWLILVLVLVTLLVTLLVFLLLFVRNPFRYPDSCLGYPDSCLCWSVNKELVPPVEDPKLNEQCGHQGSSPNALTLNISEETPMMTLSPAAPEHLTHITPLLPDAEHKAARQEEPSEHWPAIVLYAIIKEVPLRRWKEFLRLLSVADQQLERVELEAGLGLGSMERQYQMLRLWSQRSSANLNDVFSALHYMDLSGCAQLLQESLEKLQ